MRRIFVFVFLLLVALAFRSDSAAQGNGDSMFQTLPGGWEIVQQCNDAPQTPPQDWSYPGAILMAGYAGIHAMQRDWDVPRVVVALGRDADDDVPILGSQLSPDGRWYAVTLGEAFTEISYNSYLFLNKVAVYSTAGDRPPIVFDDLPFMNAGAWTFSPIDWQDNETFYVGGMRIRPFEELAEPAPFNLTSIASQPAFASPDMQTAYLTSTVMPHYGLVTLDNLETLASIGNVFGLAWKRDSTGFLAFIRHPSGQRFTLSLYDRNGTAQETILNLHYEGIDFRRNQSGRNESRWSPDDTQFAFVNTGYYSLIPKLHIIDVNSQQIVDTCLDAFSNPVWSPDGTMLAFLARATEGLKLVVVDLENETAYNVARHSIVSTQFGQPDMMGWREN